MTLIAFGYTSVTCHVGQLDALLSSIIKPVCSAEFVTVYHEDCYGIRAPNSWEDLFYLLYIGIFKCKIG